MMWRTNLKILRIATSRPIQLSQDIFLPCLQQRKPGRFRSDEFHVRMKFLAIRFSLCLCLSMFAGCGAWRGIPTHGGGKRFDEEQRIVAGAIRRTLADMELTELSGKKVAISMECISQDGGGVIS